jgi:hypothetical protein
MLVILPDGQRVDLASVTYSLAAATITFNLLAGSTTTYTDANNNAANALSVMRQLDALRTYGNPNSTTPVISQGGYEISSISPNAFDVPYIDQIDIFGHGFTASATYVLCLEDAAGGQDDNGYFFNCTYVSSTHLIGVYGGPGDAAQPIALIYLRGPGGTSSNIIACTGSGSIINIP